MSDTELYRRALVRFAISLILTIGDTLICSGALYHAVGNGAAFALILLLMILWVWTLCNIWRHALRDIRCVSEILAVHSRKQSVVFVHRDA